MARIVVKHLPYDTTEADLRELIGDVGEIVGVDLAKDPLTGHSRQTATIELATGAEAEDAVKRLNHKELRGHRLVVTHAEAAGLGAGDPMTESPTRDVADDAPAAQPHRPVREQGTNPGRWDH
jgi:RNA recognition motif-containing protein